MAIRVEYGSVMPALSLARIAGKGQATQQRRAADLALLDFGLRMEAQRDRREAQERAFSLQIAAAERRARTPMARAEVRSPFADPVQMRVENERLYQAERRKEQMTALDQMKETGQISALDYSRNRLRILGDQATRYGAEDLPISMRRYILGQQIDPLQKERQVALGWAADPDKTPEERAMSAATAAKLQARIESMLEAAGQSAQTVDPKTGTAAKTGPQTTTQRLAGREPTQAQVDAAVIVATRILGGLPPEERQKGDVDKMVANMLLPQNRQVLSAMR